MVRAGTPFSRSAHDLSGTSKRLSLVRLAAGSRSPSRAATAGERRSRAKPMNDIDLCILRRSPIDSGAGEDGSVYQQAGRKRSRARVLTGALHQGVDSLLAGIGLDPVQTRGFREVSTELVDLFGKQRGETADRHLRHQSDVPATKRFAGGHEVAKRILIVGPHDAERRRGKLGVALEIMAVAFGAGRHRELATGRMAVAGSIRGKSFGHGCRDRGRWLEIPHGDAKPAQRPE